MVAQTLQIADDVLHLEPLAAVVVRQALAGDLGEILAQTVLVQVQGLLALRDGGGFGLVIGLQQADGGADGIAGGGGHLLGQAAAGGDNHGRDGQHTAVQQLVGGVCRSGLRRDGPVRQAHQLPGKGQQQGRGAQVEDAVAHGDAGRVDGCVDDGRPEKQVNRYKQQQKHGAADNIEGDVDDADLSGAAAGADGGDHRGDAGADVLSHDNGQRRAVGDDTGQGQRLQNAHRGGGRLDDRGEHRAHQHPQQGIAEGGEQFGEAGHFPQRLHRAGHHLHAVHQHGEAHKNGAHVLFLLALGGHGHDHADHGQHQGEILGLEQLHHRAASLDAHQAQQPGGDGGADVGAHDDANRLPQCHDARIYQAHQHDGDCGGGLDHRGDHRSQQHPLHRAGGHAAENALQLAPGQLFQAVGHNIHAVQEKCQASAQRQQIEQIHTGPSLVTPFISKDSITRFPREPKKKTVKTRLRS